MQIGFGEHAAIGVFLGEHERDAPGARLDVGPEGEADVGRDAELDFVGKLQVRLGLGAAEVSGGEHLAGDRADEASILNVALAVGEVDHPASAHEGGGDALARLLALAFERTVLATVTFIDHVGDGGEVVFAGAGAVGGIVPEREACIPAHQSTAVRRDEPCELMNQALLVAPAETFMRLANPVRRLIGGHGLNGGCRGIGVDAKTRIIPRLRIGDVAVIKPDWQRQIEDADDFGQLAFELRRGEQTGGTLARHGAGHELRLTALLIDLHDAGLQMVLHGGARFHRLHRHKAK